ncbi:MAG: hypothetical protein JWN30_713 [Bacilli bacterium]|nr:hypothetical protein [Bacilli bacterium]
MFDVVVFVTVVVLLSFDELFDVAPVVLLSLVELFDVFILDNAGVVAHLAKLNTDKSAMIPIAISMLISSHKFTSDLLSNASAL